MKSLKLKFFLFFIGVGLIISLVMYVPYSNYIKRSYEETLEQVLRLIIKQYPLLADTDRIFEKGSEGADEYWDLVYAMNTIAENFGFTYIYYARPAGNGFQYLFSSEENSRDYSLEDIFALYDFSNIPDDMRKAYTEKNIAITATPYTDNYGAFISAYSPIFQGDSVVGVLGIDYEVSAIKQFLFRARVALGISIVFAAIAALALTINVSATLIRPIRGLEGVAEALANMDFAVNIRRFRNDEIGTMQRALIKIRDSLKRSMDSLNEQFAKLTTNSKRLNAVIAESSHALGTITGNMDAMQSETNTQLQSVAQTSTAITEIVKSIESLDGAVNSQAAHIAESFVDIKDMVSNIDSIRMVVEKVTKTTDELSKSSSEGRRMLTTLAESIQRIQEQSEILQNANKTISDIAGQTNILAMNAAIEAAHAGESGKGFAVVAGEIRKLAELSAKESSAISEEIKKIEEGIGQIAMVSTQTVNAVDAIFTEIQSIDASFDHVNRAVEKQSTGGSHILTALQTIQDATGQVRNGADAIQNQSLSIQGEMSKLQRISQIVTDRAYEAKLASGSIASFLEKAKGIADK